MRAKDKESDDRISLYEEQLQGNEDSKSFAPEMLFALIS